MIRAQRLATGEKSLVVMRRTEDNHIDYSLQSYIKEIEKEMKVSFDRMRLIVNGTLITDRRCNLMEYAVYNDKYPTMEELKHGEIETPLRIEPKKLIEQPISFVIMKGNSVYDRLYMDQASNCTTVFDVYQWLCYKIKGNWTSFRFYVDDYGASPEFLRNETLNSSVNIEKNLFLVKIYDYLRHHLNVIVHIYDLGWNVNYEQDTEYKRTVELAVRAPKARGPKELTVVLTDRSSNNKNRIFKLLVNLTTRIRDIKKDIETLTDIEPNEQQLRSGQTILDDNKAVGEYGLAIEIRVKRGLRGGFGREFIDVTKDQLLEIDYDSTAPAWRQLPPGLSIEGKCLNSNCIAYEKFVLSKYGLKKFDLMLEHDTTPCPMCFKYIEITKPYFSKCLWQIISVKAGGSKNTTPWKKTVGKYAKYDPIASGKAKFSHLQISAREIETSNTVQRVTFKDGKKVVEEIKPTGPMPKTCSYCMLNIAPKDKMRELPCQHIFHGNCINGCTEGEADGSYVVSNCLMCGLPIDLSIDLC